MPPDEDGGDVDDMVFSNSYEFDRIAALLRRTSRMLKEHVGGSVMADPLGGNATGDDLSVELSEAAGWLEQA
jgi:hypothetical protein